MNKILIDGDFVLWKILPNKKQTPEEIEKYDQVNEIYEVLKIDL